MKRSVKEPMESHLTHRWRALLLLAGLCSATPEPASAQWQDGSGTNPIYETNSKVGIGTSSPATDLHVKGQSGQPGRVEIQAGDSTKEASMLFYDATGLRWAIASRNGYDAPNNRLGFFNGSVTEVLTLLSGGSVGIGTTNPNRPLEVVGGLHVSGSTGELSFGNRETPYFGTGAGDRWVWYGSGGVARLWSAGDKLVVYPNGEVGIGTSYPTASAGLTIEGSNGGLYVRNGESWINYAGTNYNYFGGTTAFRDPSGTPISTVISGSGAQDSYFAATGAGRVGIGTTAPRPGADLHVKGKSGNSGRIEIQAGGTNRESALHLFDSTNSLRWAISSRNGVDGPNNRLGFFNGSVTETLTLLEDGKVGIGTQNPVAKLDVSGPATGSGITIRASGGGDVVLNSGGSLFFDGNYSYATGNYIRPLAANIQAFFTAGAERMRITSNGNVGVGTASPVAKLHVHRTDNDTNQISAWFSAPNLGDPGVPHTMSLIHYGATGDWYIRSALTTGKVILQDGGGKVGIGTQDPVTALTVKGTITAGDVTVSSAWADHVFEEDYELMPLQQVGEYIEQNGRLPGVPSAAEVLEKGVSVSQTQVKLLEKVEELTLYALAMENENARLRQELTQQKQAVAKQMQSLEERLAKLEQD